VSKCYPVERLSMPEGVHGVPVQGDSFRRDPIPPNQRTAEFDSTNAA
jgi:hypothetical protein